MSKKNLHKSKKNIKTHRGGASGSSSRSASGSSSRTASRTASRTGSTSRSTSASVGAPTPVDYNTYTETNKKIDKMFEYLSNEDNGTKKPEIAAVSASARLPTEVPTTQVLKKKNDCILDIDFINKIFKYINNTYSSLINNITVYKIERIENIIDKKLLEDNFFKHIIKLKKLIIQEFINLYTNIIACYDKQKITDELLNKIYSLINNFEETCKEIYYISYINSYNIERYVGIFLKHELDNLDTNKILSKFMKKNSEKFTDELSKKIEFSNTNCNKLNIKQIIDEIYIEFLYLSDSFYFYKQEYQDQHDKYGFELEVSEEFDEKLAQIFYENINNAQNILINKLKNLYNIMKCSISTELLIKFKNLFNGISKRINEISTFHNIDTLKLDFTDKYKQLSVKLIKILNELNELIKLNEQNLLSISSASATGISISSPPVNQMDCDDLTIKKKFYEIEEIHVKLNQYIYQYEVSLLDKKSKEDIIKIFTQIFQTEKKLVQEIRNLYNNIIFCDDKTKISSELLTKIHIMFSNIITITIPKLDRYIDDVYEYKRPEKDLSEFKNILNNLELKIKQSQSTLLVSNSKAPTSLKKTPLCPNSKIDINIMIADTIKKYNDNDIQINYFKLELFEENEKETLNNHKILNLKNQIKSLMSEQENLSKQIQLKYDECNLIIYANIKRDIMFLLRKHNLFNETHNTTCKTLNLTSIENEYNTLIEITTDYDNMVKNKDNEDPHLISQTIFFKILPQKHILHDKLKELYTHIMKCYYSKFNGFNKFDKFILQFLSLIELIKNIYIKILAITSNSEKRINTDINRDIKYIDEILKTLSSEYKKANPTLAPLKTSLNSTVSNASLSQSETNNSKLNLCEKVQKDYDNIEIDYKQLYQLIDKKGILAYNDYLTFHNKLKELVLNIKDCNPLLKEKLDKFIINFLKNIYQKLLSMLINSKSRFFKTKTSIQYKIDTIKEDIDQLDKFSEELNSCKFTDCECFTKQLLKHNKDYLLFTNAFIEYEKEANDIIFTKNTTKYRDINKKILISLQIVFLKHYQLQKQIDNASETCNISGDQIQYFNKLSTNLNEISHKITTLDQKIADINKEKTKNEMENKENRKKKKKDKVKTIKNFFRRLNPFKKTKKGYAEFDVKKDQPINIRGLDPSQKITTVNPLFKPDANEANEDNAARAASADSPANEDNRRLLAHLIRKAQNIKHKFDITHFWYRQWPDHGVPFTNANTSINNANTIKNNLIKQNFINFIDKIYEDMRKTGGGTVIHCSAGVGRTGTLFVILQLCFYYKRTLRDLILYITLTKTRIEKILELINRIITYARSRRLKLVQTFEQYKFLLELFDTNPMNNIEELEKVYNNFNEEDKKYANDKKIGLLLCNTNKNRYRDILPYDTTRVVLSGSDPCDNYINANYLYGPDDITEDNVFKNDFIASQGPLENTKKDFLRMLYERQIKRIIMLTNLLEPPKKYNPLPKDYIKCEDYTTNENLKDIAGEYNYEEKKYKITPENTINIFELNVKELPNADKTNSKSLDITFTLKP